MALLVIRDEKGRSHLVHSSVFDTHRKPVLLGKWPDIWARFDKESRK